MMVLWLWIACAQKEDTAKTDSACDPSRYAEVEAEPMPGWTPAAGCDVLCAATDSEGRSYSACYLTPEGAAICQYGEPCP